MISSPAFANAEDATPLVAPMGADCRLQNSSSTTAGNTNATFVPSESGRETVEIWLT